ncbi:MAG TPA: methyltransferase domain-containing protein [Lentisphaeria bacterium]|nr:methyltransferase domain-containing protein [Lentisphaeria bacterium]
MIEILTNTYQLWEPPVDGNPDRQVELDMGCGKGRFTLALAERYPERLILGSDVMIGRLRRLEAKVKRRGLSNVRLLRAESLTLAAFQLSPQSLDRLHLLCPDPWPKRRHRVRRLVCTDFLCRLQRILKPGGVLHLSTDHELYFADWLELFDKMPHFHAAPEAMADIVDVKTDFELQWNAEGKIVQHLCFRLQ